MSISPLSLLVMCWLTVFSNTGLGQEDHNVPQLEAALDTIFQRFAEGPGIALGVYKEGTILYSKGFGIANMDYDIPITPETVFEAGSMSMHFTAACILMLESEGKLSLDDPVRKYLEELPVYPNGEPTIRQLLHHSGGIPDYHEVHQMKGHSMSIDLNHEEAFQYILRHKSLTIAPGSDYRYSNSGYLLLAKVIEAVSGMTYRDYITTYFFEPLEMRDTKVYDDKNMIVKNRAIGYDQSDDRYTKNHLDNITAYGDGRILTTVSDMLKWMTHFGDGFGVIPSFIKKMTTRGVTNDGIVMSYALGLEHFRYRGLIDTYAHNGYWGGISAMFVAIPDKDLYLIGFSNNTSVSGGTVAFTALSKLIDMTTQESSTPDNLDAQVEYTPLAANQFEHYTGYYYNRSLGYATEIFVRGDTLMMKNEDHGDVALAYMRSDKFRILDGNQDHYVRFGKDENGAKVMYPKYGGRPEQVFISYDPVQSGYTELQHFEGKYYSEELGVKYNVDISETGRLTLSLRTKEIASYQQLTHNAFNSAHDGLIEFEIDRERRPGSFTLTDYWLGSIQFQRIEEQ